MDDQFFMKEALKEAEFALEEDEVPIGAIVVHEGKIIARAHNQVRRLRDPTAHAEILAITQASSYLGYERLNGCKMYVTIEPCIMCAGALILARIDKVIYGAEDRRFGGLGTLIDIRGLDGLNHKLEVRGGILEEECAGLIQEFFKRKRGSLQ